MEEKVTLISVLKPIMDRLKQIESRLNIEISQEERHTHEKLQQIFERYIFLMKLKLFETCAS